MTGVSNQNINLVATDPQLQDVLNYFKKTLKLELNCHHIGKVETFNSSEQTVDVTINYSKTFLQVDKQGIYSTGIKDYPLLLSCPVICLGGGVSNLTFPIQKGDDCILLFNDRDFDNWFNGSSISPPATGRLHAFADAIALVGLRSRSDLIEDYDTERASLNYGTTKVRVGEELVGILNDSTTLGTVLQDLTTKLQDLTAKLQTLTTNITAITVTCAAPGSPSSVPLNAAAFVTLGTQIGAIGTQIGTIATDIGGLLE